MTDKKVFEFERIKELDACALEDLHYLSPKVLDRYSRQIRIGKIYCFSVYKEGYRIGTTLADMGYKNGVKIMTCLETGGENCNIGYEFLGMYIALCRVEKCDKFVIGTNRKGMAKIAKENNMKHIYSEYEMEID